MVQHIRIGFDASFAALSEATRRGVLEYGWNGRVVRATGQASRHPGRERDTVIHELEAAGLKAGVSRGEIG